MLQDHKSGLRFLCSPVQSDDMAMLSVCWTASFTYLVDRRKDDSRTTSGATISVKVSCSSSLPLSALGIYLCTSLARSVQLITSLLRIRR
jgi:hypothetical protein